MGLVEPMGIADIDSSAITKPRAGVLGRSTLLDDRYCTFADTKSN